MSLSSASVNWPGIERWSRLWQSAAAEGNARDWYERLTAAYAEPQRFYHNQRHIAECLAEFDRARALAKDPVAVEFALWFHDAVYDPKSGDNEEQSAELATSCLNDAGLSRLAADVGEFVLATKSHEARGLSDAALVIDIDLSVLGRDTAGFEAFEEQVRQEYRFVPKVIFNLKRAQVLKRFLERPRLYTHEQFFQRYEAQARQNLEESLRTLTRLW